MVILLMFSGLTVALVRTGSMHGGRKDNLYVELVVRVEGPHDGVPLLVNSSDQIDKSSLVALLGVKRGLVIDATDKMESNGTHILKVSTLKRLLYVFQVGNEWSRLNDELVWEEQPPIITLLIHRLFHDVAKSFVGLIQVVNTGDDEFCPKANVFRNRMSEVSHRNVKHQHSASLVEDEVRGDTNLSGNPRPMRQLKLCLSQIGLPDGLLSQIVGIPESPQENPSLPGQRDNLQETDYNQQTCKYGEFSLYFHALIALFLILLFGGLKFWGIRLLYERHLVCGGILPLLGC